MAEAAEKQAKWTRRQFWITAAEVLGLLAILVFTALAAIAAGRAARSAQNAIQSERAWMSFSGFDSTHIASGVIDGDPVKNGLGIRITWRNTGRSPALDVNAFIDHKIIGIDDPVPTFVLHKKDVVKSMPIGPGMPASTNLRALNEQEYTSLRERKMRVYVYSRITYSDVFKRTDERFTEICTELIYTGQ